LSAKQAGVRDGVPPARLPAKRSKGWEKSSARMRARDEPQRALRRGQRAPVMVLVDRFRLCRTAPRTRVADHMCSIRFVDLRQSLPRPPLSNMEKRSSPDPQGRPAVNDLGAKNRRSRGGFATSQRRSRSTHRRSADEALVAESPPAPLHGKDG
jgi:hypothetical protein